MGDPELGRPGRRAAVRHCNNSSADTGLLSGFKTAPSHLKLSSICRRRRCRGDRILKVEMLRPVWVTTGNFTAFGLANLGQFLGPPGGQLEPALTLCLGYFARRCSARGLKFFMLFSRRAITAAGREFDRLWVIAPPPQSNQRHLRDIEVI